MARTNKCKVCGWTGESDGNRKWLGTNHNLCSECVVPNVKVESTNEPDPQMTSAKLAQAAALMSLCALTMPTTRRRRR